MKKKVLSLLVTFSMLLGLFPATAMATGNQTMIAEDQDGNQYYSLETAIAEGGKITLLDDVILAESLTIAAGDEVTLDLNGHTVTYNSTTQGEAMITNKGTLTINDSSDPDTGVINYNYTGAADSSYGKGNYTICNAGTLTVNGGKITIADLRAHAKYPIDNNSTTGDAILVINGGHLYNYNTSAIRQFCNSTTNQNSVTINGGLIEGYCAIWVQNPGSKTVNGSLSITGGELRTTAAAYVNGTSELKDVASRVYCTIDGDGGAWSDDSAVSITGGIFNENVYLVEEAPETIVIGEDAEFNGRLEAPVSFEIGVDDSVEGEIFDGDVTITGEDGAIAFTNCTFNGKLINNGGEGAVVRLFDCTFGEDAECIIDADLDDPTLDSSVTKFMFFGDEVPAVTVLHDGAVVALPGQTITLNNVAYPSAEAEEYYVDGDDSDNTVEYVDSIHGDLVSVHNVCIWKGDNDSEANIIHWAIHSHDYNEFGECGCGLIFVEYPIHIYGVREDADTYVTVTESGATLAFPFSDEDGVLMDPHNSGNAETREILKDKWTYGGYELWSRKGDVVTHYGEGPIFTIGDEDVAEWLHQQIKADAELYLDVDFPGEWNYPVFIKGVVQDANVNVTLNAGGAAINPFTAEDGTLMDPHDSPNTDITSQLTNWVYGGYKVWYELDGETVLYKDGAGQYKLDDELTAWFKEAMKQGAELKMDVAALGQWTTIAVTGVTLDKTALSLKVGNTGTLTATVAPADATDKTVTWTTSNASVATVENGTVTAKAAGTATITATAGEFSATCTVTVTRATTSSSDSSSGGSTSSSNPTVDKETTKNDDGSTTVTETKKDGTTVETTTNTDGSTVTTETKTEVKETATSTTTTTTTETVSKDADGNKETVKVEEKVVETATSTTTTTTTETKTDAKTETTKTVEEVTVDEEGNETVTTTATTETKLDNGSTGTTTVAADGTTTAEVKLTTAAVNDAAKAEEAVTLPMPEVEATTSTETAPTVTVTLPSNTESAKVEIPVAEVTGGTVAVIVHADGTEEIVKTSTITENGVALEVPNGATVKVVDNSKDFTDVPETYTLSDSIDFVSARGLFEGNTETTFNPHANTTIAQTMTVLARLEGEDFYGAGSTAKGAEWASEKGLHDGSDVYQPITREQMVVMMWKLAGMPHSDHEIDHHADDHLISDHALIAMQWAVEMGIIKGNVDGTLNPHGHASRAHVAAFSERYVNAI